MLRRSAITIGREAMMLLIIACFALSTVVSMRAQAGIAPGAGPLAGGALCLHGGEDLASPLAASLAGNPAAPADESRQCHTDCALCGGGAPVMLGTSGSLMPGQFLAILLSSDLEPGGQPPVTSSSVRLPPKQGPPARA